MPSPRRRFLVTVTWEATAEVAVRARTAEEAEQIVRDRGLPWKKAVEGDTDHHYSEVVDPGSDEEAASKPTTGAD